MGKTIEQAKAELKAAHEAAAAAAAAKSVPETEPPKQRTGECEELSGKKYVERDSPAFSAADCPDQIVMGKKGKLYISKPNKNLVYSWKLYKGEDAKKIAPGPVRRERTVEPQLQKLEPLKPPIRKTGRSRCIEIKMLYDPETGECVKDTPAMRKRMGLAPKPRSKKKSKKRSTPRKPSKRSNSKTRCRKQGKLYDPITGVCVNDTLYNRRRFGLAPPRKKSSKKKSSNTKKRKTVQKTTSGGYTKRKIKGRMYWYKDGKRIAVAKVPKKYQY